MIRYTVLEFEVGVEESEHFLNTTSHFGTFDNIKDAEQVRTDMINKYRINPQMIQVIQYVKE